MPWSRPGPARAHRRDRDPENNLQICCQGPCGPWFVRRVFLLIDVFVSSARARSAAHHGGVSRGSEHTALKWGRDGELSDLDLQRILERLEAVDPAADTLLSHFRNGETGMAPSH